MAEKKRGAGEAPPQDNPNDFQCSRSSPAEQGPLDAYCYVDTAVGGVSHRNHVMRVEDFRPRRGAVDCYRTYLQFTDALVAYLKINRNKKGNPSVKGYPGPALALVLPFDCDCEEDPTRALVDAQRVVQQWLAQYSI